MSARRRVWLGVGVLGGYVAVAAATIGLSGRHVLPLFEGVGPPPPYQWVHPPAGLAAGNTKPQPASADIAFTSGRSVVAAAATPDGQFVVNFAAGAFAARGNDTSVHAAITPLDPATLGAVPAGLAADGNAYRIQLTYQPSGTAVDTLAAASNVIMSAPNPAQALLYSPDGSSWSKLPSQTVGSASTVGSTFGRPGWYLVAGAPTAAVSGRTSHLSTAVIALLVAGLAVLLVAAPIGVRALRRRRSPARARPAPRRGRPPAARGTSKGTRHR